MKQVKELEFIFENCEVIRIKRNAIGIFYMDGIHPVIARIASNSISKYMVADTFAIEIFTEGDEEYHVFGIAEDKNTKLKRLSSYDDITSVGVIFEDGTTEEYLMNYDEGENEGQLGAPNINQKTYVSDLGNLYIVIDKEKKIEDFFDMTKINDTEDVEFSKSMMDIGIEEEPEHDFCEENLPEMYKYVYLHTKDLCALAIRVYDENAGWRFIFEDPERAIHFPLAWQYPKSNIIEFLDGHNKEFTIAKIKEKYPPKE